MAKETTDVAAWRSMLRAHHRTVRSIEAALERASSIPLTWYDVLLELKTAEDGLRMQDLAGRVVLSRTRVSRLVDELEREGLVRRAPDPDDGRATLVAITPEGDASFRETAPIYLRLIDERFNAHLEQGEAEVVARALERVADANQRDLG